MDLKEKKSSVAMYGLKNKWGLKTYLKFFFIISLCNSFLYTHTIWLQRKETWVQIPFNWTLPQYQYKTIRNHNWKMVIYSKSFSRGEIFYFEIHPLYKNHKKQKREVNHKILYLTIYRAIPVNRKNFGFNGIYVFPPTLKKKENFFLWTIKEKKEVHIKKFQLQIKIRKFPVAKNKLVFRKKKLSKQERKKIYKRILQEKEIKKIAFEELYPIFITNRLSHPRDFHYITSEWYKKRWNQFYYWERNKKFFSKPYVSIHRGVDLRGDWGDIVYAVADGKVVISHHFYYEGNFILINHGNKIFSGYMHLKDRWIPSGSFIRAGLPIGTVGATGMVTGAHLHFAIWIDGFIADPLSILSLPIR